MVSAAGLEPTTHSLGNCCSILMSYADITTDFYKTSQNNLQYFLMQNIHHKTKTIYKILSNRAYTE